MYEPQDLVYEDFIEMFQLENKYYDATYITPVEEAYKWYMKNMHSVKVVKELGCIVGFCNLFPVHEVTYQKILEGTFNDAELKAEHILAEEEMKGKIYLFFSCIVVENVPHKKQLIHRLLETYKVLYQQIEVEGNKIQGVVLDAVTKGGRHFAEQIGLTYYGVSDHGTMLYLGTFENFCKVGDK